MSDLSGFRELTRSVAAYYPAQFFVAVLLGFALACFGFGMAAGYPLVWLIDGVGAAAAILAFAVAIYAILFNNELLRSERHIIRQRELDMLGDDRRNAAARRNPLNSPKAIVGEGPQEMPSHS